MRHPARLLRVARRKTIAGTCGVCVVRDSLDILPVLCGHYLRLGFARLHFVDDGSTDGTFEFLDRLSRRTAVVTVARAMDGQYRQLEKITRAVEMLISEGFRVIFPFDADEFWNLTRNDLAQIAALREPTIVRGRWVNFVQSRKRVYPRPFGLLSVRFRAEPVEGAGREAVTAFREPFICSEMVQKVAFRTDGPVRLMKGQHDLVDAGFPYSARIFEVFHLPFRSRSELTKRGLNYEPRREPLRQDTTESWQSDFHRRIVLDGRTEAVWRANSADATGVLDVYGKPRHLVADGRMRRHMMRAAVHMAVNHGVWSL